jgi:hypothetical protein
MQNKSVLGACVLGVGGDEIINGFTNLMYAKPYTIFRDAVHIHPTVTELIPTMLKNLKPTLNTILITNYTVICRIAYCFMEDCLVCFLSYRLVCTLLLTQVLNEVNQKFISCL